PTALGWRSVNPCAATNFSANAMAPWAERAPSLEEADVAARGVPPKRATIKTGSRANRIIVRASSRCLHFSNFDSGAFHELIRYRASMAPLAGGRHPKNVVAGGLMKGKSSKTSKKPNAKPPRATTMKRCECCGDAPCSCPATHAHKR